MYVQNLTVTTGPNFWFHSHRGVFDQLNISISRSPYQDVTAIWVMKPCSLQSGPCPVKGTCNVKQIHLVFTGRSFPAVSSLSHPNNTPPPPPPLCKAKFAIQQSIVSLNICNKLHAWVECTSMANVQLRNKHDRIE